MPACHQTNNIKTLQVKLLLHTHYLKFKTWISIFINVPSSAHSGIRSLLCWWLGQRYVQCAITKTLQK